MDEPKVRLGLCRPERLHLKRDFERVFEKRQIVRGRDFRLYYYVRREEASRHVPVRAAVVAGKRIGNSVVRSRVKRLLREAIRRVVGDLNTRTGLDLIFVATADFGRSRSQEVEEEMRNLLRRPGLLTIGMAGKKGS